MENHAVTRLWVDQTIDLLLDEVPRLVGQHPIHIRDYIDNLLRAKLAHRYAERYDIESMVVKESFESILKEES